MSEIDHVSRQAYTRYCRTIPHGSSDASLLSESKTVTSSSSTRETSSGTHWVAFCQVHGQGCLKDNVPCYLQGQDCDG